MDIVPNCALICSRAVLGALFFANALGCAPGGTMASTSEHQIVPGRERTELEKFASWFHQDWKLVFPNFPEGARMYLSTLPRERKALLHQELSAFLAEHSDDSSSGLKQAWLRLGALGWQSDLDVRETLASFVRMMGGQG